mmetsp:Transcript_23685/g.93932  ORF Transcript_23685/g.93932 Transcript_23685/m.93932 type:complete len:157 (+) Transcript_23685:430-900(+)
MFFGGAHAEPRVRSYWQRLRSEGAPLDIAFEFDGRVGDTYDAHRLAAWAAEKYGFAAQDKLVEAQFVAYMVDGHAPSDKTSQLAAVEKAGLPVDEAAAVWDELAYKADVDRELAEARDRSVTGVPSFFVDGDFLTSGAIPTEAWIDHLAAVGRGKS